MSRRTFTRHFRVLTGSTVGDWLLGERLAFTQRLLETTEQSVESIATLAGFGSPVSLRHHFRKDHRRFAQRLAANVQGALRENRPQKERPPAGGLPWSATRLLYLASPAGLSTCRLCPATTTTAGTGYPGQAGGKGVVDEGFDRRPSAHSAP